MQIQLSPRNDLTGLIYQILGEGMPHIDEVLYHPDCNKVGFNPQIDEVVANASWDPGKWSSQKNLVVDVIRTPLARYVKTLNLVSKNQVRRALQYLLNTDKNASYVFGDWKLYPDLGHKKGSKTDRIFSTFQDTICPYDSYALCEWIWELLYPNESWETDISNWKVIED